MSASYCLAFFGVRYALSDAEVEALDSRADPRQAAARKAGLKTYWGKFGPDERFLLFVGTQLATLGPENDSEFIRPSGELQAIFETTASKLLGAGFVEAAQLYLQWAEDF